MIDDDDTPSPHQLADNPELAVLAVLERALHMARHAILAANPIICGVDERHDNDGCAWVAEVLHAQANALSDTLATYRHAVRVADERRSRRPVLDDF